LTPPRSHLHLPNVSLDLPIRLRRLRKTKAIRRLVRETRVTADDLIQYGTRLTP